MKKDKISSCEDYQITHLLEFVGWLESTISNVSSSNKKQGLCNGPKKISRGCRMIFHTNFNLHWSSDL